MIFAVFDTLNTGRAALASPWKTTLFRVFVLKHDIHLWIQVPPPRDFAVIQKRFGVKKEQNFSSWEVLVSSGRSHGTYLGLYIDRKCNRVVENIDSNLKKLQELYRRSTSASKQAGNVAAQKLQSTPRKSQGEGRVDKRMATSSPSSVSPPAAPSGTGSPGRYSDFHYGIGVRPEGPQIGT